MDIVFIRHIRFTILIQLRIHLWIRDVLLFRRRHVFAEQVSLTQVTCVARMVFNRTFIMVRNTRIRTQDLTRYLILLRLITIKLYPITETGTCGYIQKTMNPNIRPFIQNQKADYSRLLCVPKSQTKIIMQLGLIINTFIMGQREKYAGHVQVCLEKVCAHKKNSFKQNRKQKIIGGIFQPILVIKNVQIKVFVIFMQKTVKLMLILWEMLRRGHYYTVEFYVAVVRCFNFKILEPSENV